MNGTQRTGAVAALRTPGPVLQAALPAPGQLKDAAPEPPATASDRAAGRGLPDARVGQGSESGPFGLAAGCWPLAFRSEVMRP